MHRLHSSLFQIQFQTVWNVVKSLARSKRECSRRERFRARPSDITRASRAEREKKLQQLTLLAGEVSSSRMWNERFAEAVCRKIIELYVNAEIYPRLNK